jgi:hypothetical protein
MTDKNKKHPKNEKYAKRANKEISKAELMTFKGDIGLIQL